jgi:hypothetical protein
MVVHRRGGKTVACINELITRAAYTPKKDARYAYIAPFYRQAKDVAWQYLKVFGKGVVTKVRESELRVELFNGAWITLYGADNPDALRGLYLDGVVLDEYGDCRPRLWGTVVLPCLADRKGWAIFIGTPKGKNHFWEVNQRSQKEKGWYHLTLKASQSGLIDDEELEEMRLQMSDEEYQQEMECDFEAAVKGTYYAEIIRQMELRGNIGPHKGVYDPSLPVSVSSDLGYTDSCAWWFWQDTEGGPSIIDYYEEDSMALQHYFDMLRYKGYTYNVIWLPHDAVAKTLQTGRSTVEQFLAEDFPVNVVPRLNKQHGIDAGRKVLPLCSINQDLCHDGIEALRAYRRQYNELTKQYSDAPRHDWASNGADAYRYLALVCRGAVERISVEQKKSSAPTWEYCLEDLWPDDKTTYKFEKLRI